MQARVLVLVLAIGLAASDLLLGGHDVVDASIRAEGQVGTACPISPSSASLQGRSTLDGTVPMPPWPY